MKKIKLFALFLCISVSALAQNKSAENYFEKIVDGEKRAHGFIQNKMNSVAGSNYDVKYHRCNWTINPAVYYINGTVTTYFTSTVASLSQITFDFATSMTVDSVKYHNATRTFTQIAGNGLSITLPSPIGLGVLDSITVYYKGAPPSSGFGSFNQDVHNGTSVLWSLSEPMGASDWWPCKNSLTDKIDSVDLIITTPAAYRAAGNGLLVSEQTIGSNKIYHWQSRYPVASYLVAFAVTNYSVYSNYVPLAGGDSLLMLNYVYPEDLAYAQGLTPALIPIIQFFDSLLIQYPFSNEKYGHAQFNWGGGMEHQTMSFVTDFNHELLAHECAHQWFGDRITCGTWVDIWLNEGFATYMEALTKERFYPSTWMTWKSGAISNITSQTGGSVLCTDTTSVNRIFSSRLSYNKGAYLLHMLRWKMGDANFFQGLKNYLNDPLLAYGFAKTADLKAHLEAASGLNLTTFFTKWYAGQGFPSYQVRWNQIGSNLTVKISQTTSNASVSFYDMPVPIRFTGPGGFDTTLVFNHTASGQLFSATVTKTISNNGVTFDPLLWILSANNTVTHDIALGMDDLNADNFFFEAYPNPATDAVNIKYTLANATDVNITLTDAAGRIILTEEIKNEAPGNHLHTFNTKKLSAGIYFCEVKTNGSKKVLTVQIQK